jgi:ppGpp synthetase/RelA/SpoT-type nucleotidyltranferase
MTDLLKQAAFFKTYNISTDAFDKTGLAWADLQNIYEKHSGNITNLEATANYIAERLRQLDEAHSLKIRIKHPEHLIEKIIRKKSDDPTLDITPENYGERITDLIGIRALHLFKEDWSRIHDFIIETWGLLETPTANVRKGDAEEVTKLFIDKGCLINEHKFGYRSVHYLVKSQPSKDLFIAELQVRTIFEEGWSEIDHRIRYPYDLENSVLAQFLVMFNRLAGSADEMGSFIKFLKHQLEFRDAEHKKSLEEYDKVVAGLKAEVQKLEITKKQKEELEKRLKSLESVSQSRPAASGYGFNSDILASFTKMQDEASKSALASIATYFLNQPKVTPQTKALTSQPKTTAPTSSKSTNEASSKKRGRRNLRLRTRSSEVKEKK